MHFRDGEITDAARLARVFYVAVREGPSLYSEAQRAAWAPSQPTSQAYAERIKGMYLVVAEDQGKIVGFMGLGPGGYIDLAFVLPRSRGKGAFRRMYQIIEEKAQHDGRARLWTHASLIAEPAFRAVGFSVIQHEIMQRSGQNLMRAEMEKCLT